VRVKIDYKGIFKLLHDAGAQVRKNKGIVKFPEKLVRQYLGYCPSLVKFSDIEGNIINLAPRGDTIFWTGNALCIVKDKIVKEIDTNEFVKLVKVVDQLENVQGMVGTSLSDIPPSG